MNNFKEMINYSRIKALVEKKGYDVESAEFSFALGEKISYGHNPSGLYGALGIKKHQNKDLDARIILGPRDVVVLIGKTIAKARYFSYLPYQHSYFLEGWNDETKTLKSPTDYPPNRVITNTSIVQGFNNLTLKTGDGRASKGDAPFVIIFGSSEKDNETIAKILNKALPDDVLSSHHNVNIQHIPRQFTMEAEENQKDELYFIHRITLINQAFGEPTNSRAIAEMTESYKKDSPFITFIARGKATTLNDSFTPSEGINKRNTTAIQIRDLLIKQDYRWEELWELRTKSKNKFSRLFHVDAGWDNPDALYGTPMNGEKLLEVVREIKSANRENVNVKAAEFPYVAELGEGDALIITGIHHTAINRVVYFSFDLYDSKFENGQGVKDSDIYLTTDSPEIFTFAIVRDEASKIILARSLGRNFKNLKIIVLNRKYEKMQKADVLVFARIYVDLVTGEAPDKSEFHRNLYYLYTREKRN